MNEQVEALRKKYRVRKDYMLKFLNGLDTTITLEEVLFKIEEKYGNGEKGSGPTEEAGDDKDISVSDNINVIPDAEVEDITDKVSERGNTERECDQVHAIGRLPQYCPLTGEVI